MGGDYHSFGFASMFDFEVLLSAYKQRNGVKEDDISSTDDLDQLYAKMGGHMKTNPEAWK